MGWEFLGERNSGKTLDILRGIADVKSVNQAFECHNDQNDIQMDIKSKKAFGERRRRAWGIP